MAHNKKQESIFSGRYATKEDRIILYRVLIERIEEEGFFTMCPVLATMMNNIRHPMDYLPELWQQRPEYIGMSGIWFNLNADGMQKRKKCLEEAIKLCKL
jgi:hypothetical protein